VLLKWPVVVLVLFLAAIWLTARGVLRLPRALWVMLSFPAVYFAVSLLAHFDIGDRHILPVYPFVLVVVGGLWDVARKRRVTMAFLGVLLALHVVDGLRYAPGYLSYFDVFVPPTSSYHLLTDSNLDWGQGLLVLRHYQAQHPDEQLWLAYFGSVDPATYGIKAHLLGENQRVEGTVVVSASDLSGQYLENPASYRWVLQYPRTDILDHSIYVFKVGAR
jgi:hypothetical protein